MRSVAKLLLNMLIFLTGTAVSGVLAYGLTGTLSAHGVFGSCFEGACGYRAMFVGFPLIWIGMTIAFLIGWIWLARRTS